MSAVLYLGEHQYVLQDEWRKYGKSVQHVQEDGRHLHQEGGDGWGWVEEEVWAPDKNERSPRAKNCHLRKGG